MNIFVLSENPQTAAIMQCDKHVIKMILESAQILCTVHRVLDGPDVPDEFYKATHVNHPCTKWARQSSGNYMWLYDHFIALCKEYERRYGRIHATYAKLQDNLFVLPCYIRQGPRTPFVMCMPDEIREKHKGRYKAIKAYREYYRSKLRDMQMCWTNAKRPVWI